MRIFTLSLLFLAWHEGRAASKTILLTPENVDEDCAQSWQVTESESQTQLRFQDLSLEWTGAAAAQIKHCRIAWKPVIPAGCYAPSARLELRGHFKDPGTTRQVRAQLRLSHDLLGQGDSSKVQSFDLAEGPFQVSIELPPERFQKRWEDVKLITHLSLYLRRPKPNMSEPAPRDSVRQRGLTIETIELEAVRSEDCPAPEARR